MRGYNKNTNDGRVRVKELNKPCFVATQNTIVLFFAWQILKRKSVTYWWHLSAIYNTHPHWNSKFCSIISVQTCSLNNILIYKSSVYKLTDYCLFVSKQSTNGRLSSEYGVNPLTILDIQSDLWGPCIRKYRHHYIDATWAFVQQFVWANMKKEISKRTLLVRGIHRLPMNFPHKGLVTQNSFPCHNVIMTHLFLCVTSRVVKLILYNCHHIMGNCCIH